jgi:hypothetical protein
MKTLSLAGLKANEIIGVTKDVLNFSVAGDTSIQAAADTLVSVTTYHDRTNTGVLPDNRVQMSVWKKDITTGTITQLGTTTVDPNANVAAYEA